MQQHDTCTSTAVDVSSEKQTDGLTRIGEFTICTHGRAAMPGNDGGRRYPVHREEVEVAKSVLGACRRTRWARKGVSPSAETLSNMMVGHDDGADFSVSTGAVIIAASELGIVWVPDGERDALIGVNIDDVKSSPPIAQTRDDDNRELCAAVRRQEQTCGACQRANGWSHDPCDHHRDG